MYIRNILNPTGGWKKGFVQLYDTTYYEQEDFT